jgi:hypothetical protein
LKIFATDGTKAEHSIFENQRNTLDSMNATSPWRTTPRSSVVIFLLAVFCVFGIIGIATDLLDMGGEQPIRFVIGVVATGLFAVAYAFTGISLRGKFWIAFFPLMALQLFAMTLSANWFPDPPRSAQPSFSEIEHMHGRLTFDAIAIIAAVAMGYAGFVVVFVREGRRHIRAHTEKAILDGEMAAAREVQLVMLPGSGESFPGYAVESIYRPAQEVGGDFFQILPVGSSGLLIVLGDVAGKGLPAAMLVSMLVGSIRILAEDTHDPVLILRKLHDRLMGRTRGGFSTALAAFIADDGHVTIANAGHLSPYLDGREIELQGALPLGIAGGAHYESMSFELGHGSRLTFISDGVVEAQDKTGKLFGFERAEAMSQEPAAAIVKAAVDFGQSDDITVVTIERLATAKVIDAA